MLNMFLKLQGEDTHHRGPSPLEPSEGQQIFPNFKCP